MGPVGPSGSSVTHTLWKLCKCAIYLRSKFNVCFVCSIGLCVVLFVCHCLCPLSFVICPLSVVLDFASCPFQFSVWLLLAWSTNSSHGCLPHILVMHGTFSVARSVMKVIRSKSSSVWILTLHHFFFFTISFFSYFCAMSDKVDVITLHALISELRA